MIIIQPAKRQSDSFGSGHYGASRGSRKHNGIDYACLPGGKVLSPVSGSVTKLGYPYGDDLSFRYVQITDSDNIDHRVFYCDPKVKVGDHVTGGLSMIGYVQDLDKRYPRITPHIHYEVKKNGEFIHPESRTFL